MICPGALVCDTFNLNAAAYSVAGVILCSVKEPQYAERVKVI